MHLAFNEAMGTLRGPDAVRAAAGTAADDCAHVDDGCGNKRNRECGSGKGSLSGWEWQRESDRAYTLRLFGLRELYDGNDNPDCCFNLWQGDPRLRVSNFLRWICNGEFFYFQIRDRHQLRNRNGITQFDALGPNGNRARPFHSAWIRSGAAFFRRQWQRALWNYFGGNHGRCFRELYGYLNGF